MTVNRFLAGGIALCALGIGYLVYRNFLASEGNGERVVLGVMLGLLALPMSIALWMRVDQKINVILVAGASVTALYIAELVVLVTTTTIPVDWIYIPGFHGYHEITRRADLAKKVGIHFDQRTRIDVIRDLEATGVDAVPAIPPSIVLKVSAGDTSKSALSLDGYELVPLAGIADRVTVYCNENGEYTVYKSDEHGFHNPKGRWALNRIDVAFLGDSFTAGACVSTEKNFAALVAAAHPATLNLGADNNGPLMELAALREYLVDVRPKVVVWGYFEGNDLDDLDGEWKSPLLRSYLKRGFKQGLAARQHEVDRELLSYVREVRGTSRWAQRLRQADDVVRLKHLRALIASALQLHRWSAQESQARDLTRFRIVLAEAAASVRSWGGSLYFVYLPEWKRYARPALARSDRDAILAMVKELGIHVIDIHRALAKEPNPLTFFPFGLAGHYNEQGHRLVANEINNGIARSDLQSSGVRRVGATYSVQH